MTFSGVTSIRMKTARVLKRTALSPIVAVSLALSAFAQAPEPVDYDTARLDKNVTALRITEEISVDGLLDEAAWDLAEPATDFVQRRPIAGIRAIDRTEARFLFDNENLYVGILLFDSEPERITINDLEEDFGFQGSDMVVVGPRQPPRSTVRIYLQDERRGREGRRAGQPPRRPGRIQWRLGRGLGRPNDA